MLKTFDMKQTTTKEVLHTQGKWTFTNSNNDDYIDIDVDGNRVCSIFLIAQEEAGVSQKECEANAELICQAVNERQKLLDNNRELLEALIEMHNMVQGANIEKTDRMYNAITNAQKAIKNKIGG